MTLAPSRTQQVHLFYSPKHQEHGGSHPRDKQAPGRVQHGRRGYHPAAADSSGGDSGTCPACLLTVTAAVMLAR